MVIACRIDRKMTHSYWRSARVFLKMRRTTRMSTCSPRRVVSPPRMCGGMVRRIPILSDGRSQYRCPLRGNAGKRGARAQCELIELHTRRSAHLIFVGGGAGTLLAEPVLMAALPSR